MPRMTAEERAQLDALSKRAKEEDDQNASFEVVVENKDGLKVKLTGAKARKFLEKHGLADEDESEEEGEEGDELPEDEPPAGADGYFKRRK